MKKRFVVLGVGLAMTLIVSILYFIPASSQPETTPNFLNTWLYATLVGVGIDDAVVDVTPERALIRYNLPENLSKEAVQYYIMADAAIIAPNFSKIVIQTYKNFIPLEEAVVATKDVLAFMNESITFDEFKEGIEIKLLKNDT